MVIVNKTEQKRQAVIAKRSKDIEEAYIIVKNTPIGTKPTHDVLGKLLIERNKYRRTSKLGSLWKPDRPFVPLKTSKHPYAR